MEGSSEPASVAPEQPADVSYVDTSSILTPFSNLSTNPSDLRDLSRPVESEVAVEELLEYEYDAAFAIDDCVRIEGEEDDEWAEDDGMNSYWSKTVYRVVEMRMGPEASDLPDDDQDGIYDTEQDAAGDDSLETTQEVLTAEEKIQLDARTWYYKVSDMSSDKTEDQDPVADTAWWAERQLVFDAEATSRKDYPNVELQATVDREAMDPLAVDEEVDQEEEEAEELMIWEQFIATGSIT